MKQSKYKPVTIRTNLIYYWTIYYLPLILI